MCMSPSAPAAPPPLPAQAPPVVPVLDTSATGNTTANAIAANKGRTSLRIDKTVNVPGAAGSGLNIPA